MAEEEQVNGAPAADDATSTPAPQDATGTANADEEEIDYDAVAPEGKEGDADDSGADGSGDEEADDEEEEGPEYTTGAPPGDIERNSGLGAAAGQPELADALGALPPQDTSERPEVRGGRDYELIFIARSDAADAIDEITQNIRTLVEEREGAVDHVRQSELRRLAYPIKKETEGYYVVLNGRFRPDTLPDLERQLKLEDRILRYMIIRQDG